MNAPSTGRRTLFGGGASLMLLAASAAGQAKAQELDEKLLALCARWHAADAAWRHHSDTSGWGEMPSSAPRQRVFGAENGALSDAAHSLLDEIADTPASTPEGIRAKAEVVRAYFKLDYPEKGCAGGDALWSMLCDIVGRPA